MSDVNAFLKTFDDVFEKDGSVKNCGRQVCVNLIMQARSLDQSKRFGNVVTGFMNVDEILELKKSLKL